MDENDRAMELAQAAYAARGGDLDALDRALKKLRPTTGTFARAYTICLTKQPFSGDEANRLILSTLQFALAEETTRKLTVLTRWLVVLTFVLVGFGVLDIVMKLCGGG
jgi:hypothetical protein